MREYRNDKETKEHYTSLDALRAAFGCKPIVKRTKDENKLQAQKDAFRGKHKCKACDQPMSYVGGNMMACTNKACKGIKIERILPDGTKSVTYDVAYDLLDDTGAEIAKNLFF